MLSYSLNFILKVFKSCFLNLKDLNCYLAVKNVIFMFRLNLYYNYIYIYLIRKSLVDYLNMKEK